MAQRNYETALALGKGEKRSLSHNINLLFDYIHGNDYRTRIHCYYSARCFHVLDERSAI